jgi:hypothetical protein
MPDPPVKILVRSQRGIVDAEPAIHGSAAHDETLHMTLRGKDLGRAWINAQEQAALAAGADGHVSIDQEGEAAEHGLLSHTVFTRQGLAQAVREFVIVCHESSIACRLGCPNVDSTVDNELTVVIRRRS